MSLVNILKSATDTAKMNAAIPDSLPPPRDADKTVTLTMAEFTSTLRLLVEYERQLKNSIQKIRHQMDEHIRTHDTLPMPPPELDHFCTNHTLAKNMIQKLEKKSPF